MCTFELKRYLYNLVKFISLNKYVCSINVFKIITEAIENF